MQQVPKIALTIGVATLLDAHEIVILATGAAKSEAIQKVVEGAISHWWPITALQMHRRTLIVCDEPARFELKLKTVRYFEELEAENIDLSKH